MFSGNNDGSKHTKTRKSSDQLPMIFPSSQPKISPIVPSELQSLTTMIPEKYYHLYKIILAMSSNMKDQFGQQRLIPSKAEWHSLHEDLPHFDAKGNFLGVESTVLETPPIFVSDCTSVFMLSNDPNKVVRYHCHLESSANTLDPTVLDYWCLKRIESGNIAPRVYYYSGPLDPNEYNSKGEISVPGGSGKTKRFCGTKVEGIKPAIRYAILDKVGQNVHRYIYSQPERKLTFANAIRLGGQMIELVEKLHGYGVIHGNVHNSNFAIHNNRIVMIDFGHAQLIHRSEQMDRYFRARSDYSVSADISIWEMKCAPHSYRDDVYRVMYGIASAIHGNAYSQYMDHICDFKNLPRKYVEIFRDHVIDMKLSGEIFEIPEVDVAYIYPHYLKTSFSLEEILPDSVLSDARRILSEIMSDLLKVDIFSRPDYVTIKRKFIDLLILVEGSVPQVIRDPSEVFDMIFSDI